MATVFMHSRLGESPRFSSAFRYGAYTDSEGDVSSIADISTVMAASDTDEEEVRSDIDTRKYRMPGPRKSKLEIHTNALGTISGVQTPNRIPSTPLTPRIVPSPKYQISPRRRNGDHDTSDSEFFSSAHSRAGSVYSLSRMSFTSQLAQLTSIQLPSASALSAKMSSMESADAAVKALSNAGDQIKRWTRKASEVLDDIDAKDDVEWAAAGGRDGLEDVDGAIARFEGLVKVYVISMEELHMRKDAASLSSEELASAVGQMEEVVKDWQKIKDSLRAVKEQVEIAMEWEELWNNVLGEIGQELDALGGLIFEMEEKRHRSADFQTFVDATKGIDINDLANIVHDRRGGQHAAANPRLSLPPPFSPTSPIESPASGHSKDDTNLLGLFARMQPMRASLDFLPMRLSVFHCRGNPLFPTACVDLERKRDALEEQWKRLETDAEALRRELGEDRWVLVFRNAGRQALKMCESVERSHNKLDTALTDSVPQVDSPAVMRMVESYDAKKTHYVPAIERVLAIIDRGVLDRLTVNGEILRLQSDLKRRWAALQSSMRDLDIKLEETNAHTRNQNLRDSISTILSSERSMLSSILDTPKSSPSSSIILASGKGSKNRSVTPTSIRRTPSSSTMSSQARISNIPRTTTSSKPRFNQTHSMRTVSSPLPGITGPYKDKGPEEFRAFKDPLNKPRFSLGKSTKSPSSTREPFQRSTTESPSTRKTPSRLSTPRTPGSSIPTPGQSNSRAVSPSPIMFTPSPRKYLKGSPSTLPPRASTSLGNRTVSSGPKFNAQQTRSPSSSPQQLHSAKPHSARKSSLLGLPPLHDVSDADTEGQARPSSRLSRSSNALVSSRRSSIHVTQGSAYKSTGRDSRLDNSNRKASDAKAQWRF